MTENERKDNKIKGWMSWLGVVVVLIAAYFINVQVQTHLGKQALDATGLNGLSIEEALAAASKQNKKVLVDMSAIWCPTCRRLDKEIFSNEEVQQALLKNYVFSRVEYESEEGEQFMEKYGVNGFPTLVVLDSAGAKLKQLKLTFDPKSFINQL